MGEERGEANRKASLLHGYLLPRVVGVENAEEQFPLFPAQARQMEIFNIIL